MPQIVRNIRHLDKVATLGPNGFVPYTATRDAAHRCGSSCSCRTRSAPTRPAVKQASAADATGKLTTKLQGIARETVRAGGSLHRLSDSLDRLNGAIGNVRAVADLREAAVRR